MKLFKDAFGDRTSSTINGVTSTHTFNNESQLTNTGYVYDALGRNTYIPSVDAPNNNGGISLAYNLVDQVTAITQATSSSFTYDSLGRRVNETNGGLTTVRHYTNSSDNPEWTSQLDGTLLTTEIYTGSLGAGLGVTTNIRGTTKTQTMQITDLKGHTVTTLNLSTNSVSSWSTYDSFGNPQTSQTTTNLINYSSYGQQERATSNGSLILMGARVYNPKTNQFTSKDPIPGGNENSYTYPNDPVSQFDFDGLKALSEWEMFAFETTLDIIGILISAEVCAGIPYCAAPLAIAIAIISNVISQEVDLAVGPASLNSKSKFNWLELGFAAVSAGLVGKVTKRLLFNPWIKDVARKYNLLEPIKWAVEKMVSTGLGIVWEKISASGRRPMAPSKPGRMRSNKSYT